MSFEVFLGTSESQCSLGILVLILHFRLFGPHYKDWIGIFTSHILHNLLNASFICLKMLILVARFTFGTFEPNISQEDLESFISYRLLSIFNFSTLSGETLRRLTIFNFRLRFQKRRFCDKSFMICLFWEDLSRCVFAIFVKLFEDKF